MRPIINALLVVALFALPGCGGGTKSTTVLNPLPTPQTHVYDLSGDFSFANNPNGVWQYGYSATSSLAPDQFQKDTVTDTSNPVGFWHPTTSVNTGVTSGYYPYIAQNATNMSRTDPTNGWAVRAGEVAMEGSGSGQYSLVRFVAPQAADYQVTANFEGIHFNLSTTDVHVLQNATSVFDANINGYGGDPTFHAVQGASPTASYTGTLHLKASDIVTFAVGVGTDQTVFNDTTGLFVHITSVF